MPKCLNITEARKSFLELPERLEQDSVIITKHGKPVMALVSYERFESLVETLDILSDKTFAAKLRESVAQTERETLGEVEARLSH